MSQLARGGAAGRNADRDTASPLARDGAADRGADWDGTSISSQLVPGGAADGGGELPAWSGGEVLESGAERPAGEGGAQRAVIGARRWWRSTTAAGPWRRRTAVAVAGIAAAGAIVALRAGAPAPPQETPAAAGAPTPVIIYGRARMQPPPFDRLPGRTPIPQPSPVGRPAEAVRGTLPATGTAPGETAARGAVQLVLGRYCRWPRAYYIQLEPGNAWREVNAIVLPRGYVAARRLTTLQLRWTGRSYGWQGWPTELARCA